MACALLRFQTSSISMAATDTKSVLLPGMQQIKLRRLAASHQACFYGAKSPVKAVPRLIDVPFERQLSRQISQCLRGEVFAALNAVGAEAKLPVESRSLF